MKRNYEEDLNIPNSIFLGNINTEEMNKENMMLVVVINNDNVDYYDSLYSYIESNKINLDDKKTLKLFLTIIKKGLNYVYLIIE